MKKKLLILLLITAFVFINKVDAVTVSAEITCDKTKIKAEETATCTIKGHSDSNINAVDMDISVSSNLEIASIDIDSKWGYGNDGAAAKEDNKIRIVSEDMITGEFAIATVKVKAKANTVNKDETITISNIEIFNDESVSNVYSAATATANIRIPNNDAKLKTLSINGVTLNPTFSADKTSYTATSSTSSVTVSATANDTNATVTGTGLKTLSYGDNKIDIVVTAEDSTKKTYTITINRPDNRSDDNFLYKFEFIDNDIKFDKNKTEYNLVVENNIEALGTCYNTKKDNMLCINLTDEDEMYHQKAEMNIIINDKDLEEIYAGFDDILDELFNECTEENCEVEKDGYKLKTNGDAALYLYKDNVEILSIESDEQYKGYFRLSDLKVGNNVLKVVVTSEKDEDRTYTFNINRKDKDGKIVEEISDSPSTGNVVYIVVAIILVISLGVSIYIIKNKNKKEK